MEINTNIGIEGQKYINWAKQNGYETWAMFSNNSYQETTSKILNSYELRTKVINDIVTYAIKYELDGINLDFENMATADKDMYNPGETAQILFCRIILYKIQQKSNLVLSPRHISHGNDLSFVPF